MIRDPAAMTRGERSEYVVVLLVRIESYRSRSLFTDENINFMRTTVIYDMIHE
jgi:hypothetical protein